VNLDAAPLREQPLQSSHRGADEQGGNRR